MIRRHLINSTTPYRRHTQQGVGLVEVLVAVLLVSFGILGLVGLQGASIGITSDTRYRVEATALADALVARLWLETGIDNVLPAYVGDNTLLPTEWLTEVNRLPGATANPPTLAASAGVVTLTVRWQPPNGRVSNHQVVTTVVKQ
jgi:type IV pilus assembly protein PilV